MRPPSGPSLALGALLGAAATATVLLLPGTGDELADGPTSTEPGRTGAGTQPRRVQAATTSSAEESSNPPTAMPRSEPRDQGPVVHWLSGKLEEAYKTEALPEIIGSEAGREAGRQTMAYLYGAYDIELLEPELSSALADIEESPSLEDPWRLGPRGLDCQEPPCLLRLGIEGGGSPEDCTQALRQLVSRFLAAAPSAVIGLPTRTQLISPGECSEFLTVHTASSSAREQELTQGIEGFLEVFGQADRDTPLLERARAE